MIRFLRLLASASFGVEAEAGVSEALTDSLIAFSSRVLGFYGLGLGAQALGREAASERTHQRHIENQCTGFQLCLGAPGRDQLIFCSQNVEVGGQCTLVAPVDNLMGFCGSRDWCPRCGALSTERPAA